MSDVRTFSEFVFLSLWGGLGAEMNRPHWAEIVPYCTPRKRSFVALFRLVSIGWVYAVCECCREQVGTREIITIREMEINTALHFTSAGTWTNNYLPADDIRLCPEPRMWMNSLCLFGGDVKKSSHICQFEKVCVHACMCVDICMHIPECIL